MITIRMQGGLGNQMFQYALYKSLVHNGYETEIDVSAFIEQTDKRPLDIIRFPNVRFREQRKSHIIIEPNDSKMRSVIHRLMGHSVKHVIKDCRNAYMTEAAKPSADDTYMDGYWCNEAYFCEIADEIRKDYTFPLPEDNPTNQSSTTFVAEMLKQIRSSQNGCSVHFRRGDYLEADNMILGGVCTERYYQNAMKILCERFSDVTFYLFSDDISFLNTLHRNDNMIIVNRDEAWDNITDMNLMASCKHHIVANSSFSWWGAWLGEHENGMTICPPVYEVGGGFHNDMYPERWVRAELQ